MIYYIFLSIYKKKELLILLYLRYEESDKTKFTKNLSTDLLRFMFVFCCCLFFDWWFVLRSKGDFSFNVNRSSSSSLNANDIGCESRRYETPNASLSSFNSLKLNRSLSGGLWMRVFFDMKFVFLKWRCDFYFIFFENKKNLNLEGQLLKRLDATNRQQFRAGIFTTSGFQIGGWATK